MGSEGRLGCGPQGSSVGGKRLQPTWPPDREQIPASLCLGAPPLEEGSPTPPLSKLVYGVLRFV